MYSRILICGGRQFEDLQYFQSTMKAAHDQKLFAPKFCVIEGGANGADRMGRIWAKMNGFPLIAMEANWAYYAKGAGTLRNTWMLDWAIPDLIIAMPGGPGTRNMISQATERGIRVFPQ